jgi:hypothetical protein
MVFESRIISKKNSSALIHFQKCDDMFEIQPEVAKGDYLGGDQGLHGLWNITNEDCLPS